MNMTGSYQGMDCGVASKQHTLLTLTGRLEELLKQLHLTDSAAIEVSDALGGPVPRPANTADLSKAGDLVSRLHSLVSDCSDRVHSVNGEIGRLRGLIG